MPSSIKPSSYSGIWKFPMSTDITSRSPIGWILGKRQDDDIGPDLWRVHDKLYNLQSFIKSHPGGSEWLEITRGTDITEAFESAHIVNVEFVERMLAKFYIRKANQPRVSPYTFKHDGFYKVLKSRVRPLLQETGTDPTTQAKVIQDALVISYFTLSIFATIYESIFLQIMTGFVLTMAIIGGHNFVHLKENWRKYYFDLGFLSSYEFRITHALSHHLYPNTVMDFEMYMLEPYFKFFPTSPKYWIQRFAPILYSNFYYAVAFHLFLINRWMSILRGKQSLRIEYLLSIAQLLIFIVLSSNFIGGLISWCVINGASSYLFLLCGVNAGHHHVDAFHDGDEARADPDFGLCQLDALIERTSGIEKYLITALTSFGEHSLHHLFPTVCHSRLDKIKPIFLKTVIEFSEEFHTATQWNLFLGTFKVLERIEPKLRGKSKNQ